MQSKHKAFFHRQVIHYAILAGLLAVLKVMPHDYDLFAGQFAHIGTPVWFDLNIAVVIIHQTYVWLSWRSELCYSFVSRLLKSHAFLYHSIIFFTLLLLRLLLVCLVAISNVGTLYVNHTGLTIIAVLFMIPLMYLYYSVIRYFGFKRAAGIDHFDPSYGNSPLVTQGIFRFLRNPMYTVGMLILWIPGLILASKAAILSAVFQSVYIWVHYFCTEKPDMELIYKQHKD